MGINFHTDHSEATMQIALNGDDEYQGGRLTYVTSKGFSSPARPRGSITVHDNTILHGVSLLEAGMRYGLFLLQTPESSSLACTGGWSNFCSLEHSNQKCDWRHTMVSDIRKLNEYQASTVATSCCCCCCCRCRCCCWCRWLCCCGTHKHRCFHGFFSNGCCAMACVQTRSLPFI